MTAFCQNLSLFQPCYLVYQFPVLHFSYVSSLTLCSARAPATGVTAAGVGFTSDTGVLEMGVVGRGWTGGGVVGIGAAAGAGAGVSAAGAGSAGWLGGAGGGFAATASPNTQPHLRSSYTTRDRFNIMSRPVSAV